MKKNLKLNLITIIIVSVFIFSSVSAAFSLGDLGMTGNAVIEGADGGDYPKCYGTGTYVDSEGGYFNRSTTVAGGLTITGPCNNPACSSGNDWYKEMFCDPTTIVGGTWEDTCNDDGTLREYFVKMENNVLGRYREPKYRDMDCGDNYECLNTGIYTFNGVSHYDVGMCVEKNEPLTCNKVGGEVIATDKHGKKITFNHGWSGGERETIDGCFDMKPRLGKEVDDPNDGFPNQVIHVGANEDGEWETKMRIVYDCDPVTHEVTMRNETCAGEAYCVSGVCEASKKSCTPVGITGITFTDSDGNAKSKTNICSDSEGKNKDTTGTHLKTFTCEGDDPKSTPISCPAGCRDGVCVGVTCSDEDDQNNQASLGLSNYANELDFQIHGKGITTISGAHKMFELTDECVGANTVLEYWCESSTSPSISAATFNCPNGQTCSDGKCSGTSAYSIADTSIIPQGEAPILECSTGVQTQCVEGVYFICVDDNFVSEGETPGECGIPAESVSSCTSTDSTGDAAIAGWTRRIVDNEIVGEESDVCSEDRLILTEYNCTGEEITPRSIFCSTVGTGYVCSEGACVAPGLVPLCTSTDPSNDNKIFGTTTVTGANPEIKRDICLQNDILREYSCDSNSRSSNSDKDCTDFGSDYICSNGACTSPTAKTCVSGNPGNSFGLKDITVTTLGGVEDGREEDECDVSTGKLVEWHCDAYSDKMVARRFDCADWSEVENGVCVDGACIESDPNVVPRDPVGENDDSNVVVDITFDSVSEDTVYTKSGTTANKIALNGAGKERHAMGFGTSNTNGRLSVLDSNSRISEEITLLSWINLYSDVSLHKYQQGIMDKSNWNGKDGYWLSFNGGYGSDKLVFRIYYGNTYKDVKVDVTSLNRGSWYLVGATYDGSISKLYIWDNNGVSVASGQTAINQDMDITTNPLKIGNNFAGKIDEVKVFSEALTGTEIKELYF